MSEFVLLVFNTQTFTETLRCNLFGSLYHCLDRIKHSVRHLITRIGCGYQGDRERKNRNCQRLLQAAPDGLFAESHPNEDCAVLHGMRPAGEENAGSVRESHRALRVAAHSLARKRSSS